MVLIPLAKLRDAWAVDDAHDDELRWRSRRQPDLGHDAPLLTLVRWVGLGNARRQLIPSGLRRSWVAASTRNSRSSTPISSSLAGALNTPTRASERAKIPATCPHGGTDRPPPPSAAATLTHG